MSSAREACLRAILLFDECRFFEAHEQFEHAWKDDDTDEEDRPFWKGVTQVAVGCCHAQRGNRRSSVPADLFDGAVEEGGDGGGGLG